MKTILRKNVDDMIERIERRISQLEKYIDEYKRDDKFEDAIRSDIRKRTFELILSDLKSFVSNDGK